MPCNMSTLHDSERRLLLCAQKNQSYQHWAYHREGVNTVNAIMGGFREGAMKNRFGQRIRAKLGTNLNEARGSLPYTV